MEVTRGTRMIDMSERSLLRPRSRRPTAHRSGYGQAQSRVNEGCLHTRRGPLSALGRPNRPYYTLPIPEPQIPSSGPTRRERLLVLVGIALVALNLRPLVSSVGPDRKSVV